jgi:hypothetical protein
MRRALAPVPVSMLDVRPEDLGVILDWLGEIFGRTTVASSLVISPGACSIDEIPRDDIPSWARERDPLNL